MHVVSVMIKPLEKIILRGTGDKVAGAPGYGSIVGDEPVLPRLETLLGLMASIYYEETGAGASGDWGSVVAEKAVELVAPGASEAMIYGPFLEVEASGGHSVFINVGAGLLRLDGCCVDRFIELYRAASRILSEAVPRGKISVLGKHRDIINEMRSGEPPCLIDQGLLRSYETGIALDRFMKVTGVTPETYGMMYRRMTIDYRGALARILGDPGVEAWITLYLYVDSADEPLVEKRVAGFGPRRKAVLIETMVAKGRLYHRGLREGSYVLAISPLPARRSELEKRTQAHAAEPIVNPLTMKLHDTVYARGYSELKNGKLRYRKTEPIYAVMPGTIIHSNNAAQLIDSAHLHIHSNRNIELRPYIIL